MRDEDNVLEYYQQFNFLAKPLLDTSHLITDEQDMAFWYGFHLEDRGLMTVQLIAKCPDKISGEPYPFLEVFSTAHATFSGSHHPPLQLWDNLSKTHTSTSGCITDPWDTRNPQEANHIWPAPERRHEPPFFEARPRDNYRP
jgi:hypothetical protein